MIVWRHRVRRILKELNEYYPDIAHQARSAGMKTLAELELYPDASWGSAYLYLLVEQR